MSDDETHTGIIPYDLVRKHFDMPFPLYPFQRDIVNETSYHQRAGYYWEPGTGKTAASTHHALWRMLPEIRDEDRLNHWFVVVPPILIPQWEFWLKSVINKDTGQPLSVTAYVGTPAKRKKLSLDVEFVILSYQILKMDFDYLYATFEGRKYGVLADEATAIKNHESITHKAVAILSEGRALQLLTGTPLNKPNDAYAYVKLVSPGVYRTRREFDRCHVEAEDEWGNVTRWKNLDMMAGNLLLNSSRILRREVRRELPDVVYTPIVYKLSDEHLKLYHTIAEERLVEFEGKTEIDAISASALRSALQQIIVNWAEFSGDASKRPAILDIIDEVMDEISDKKLVLVANFRRSNQYLCDVLKKSYGAVAIYGDISPPKKLDALRSFIKDPQCRIILLHPESAGFGIDGLQHVCSDMLIVEAPTTPIPFQQVVARLDRDGQNDVVHVRTAIAQGTVQVGMFRSLMAKDALANSIQGGYKDLKDSIYGS